MSRTRTTVALTAAASIFAACAALVGTGAARAADPVKIRLSYVVPIANWTFMLMEKKDLARNLGKSYQLEITRFAGTPPMITALAAGELDIANLTYPTLPIAIRNAGMDDLRVISDDFQDGNSGYYSNEFMVLADGPIKRVEDLKGKVVATNAAGSAVDYSDSTELSNTIAHFWSKRFWQRTSGSIRHNKQQRTNHIQRLQRRRLHN
jgi:ABC-type nitrate/sulfonate/bicarbonate transport system substrate-binding protein